MTERSAHDRRQRRILIGVALMFFAPLGLSFYLYYGREWHPGSRVNAGELIEPPRPLPSLALPLAKPIRSFSKVSGRFCTCSTAAATMSAADICMTRARFAWRWIAK